MPLSASKIHIPCCLKDMVWNALPAPAELGKLVPSPLTQSCSPPSASPSSPTAPAKLSFPNTHPSKLTLLLKKPAQVCDIFDRPGWGRQRHMHWCQQIGEGWARKAKHFLTSINSTHNIPTHLLCLKPEAKFKQCSIKQGKNLGQELCGSLAAATKPWDTKAVLPLSAKNSGLKWEERLHGEAASHLSMFYLMKATARTKFCHQSHHFMLIRCCCISRHDFNGTVDLHFSLSAGN